MKKGLFLSFLAMVVLSGSALCSTGGQEAVTTEDLEILASEFVELLAKGDFTEAVTNYDSTMKEVMPPEITREAWESLISRLGAFKGQAGIRTEKQRQHDIVFVTCEFETYHIDIKVVFDRSRRIAGLWFVPSQSPVEYRPPPYSKPGSFREIETSVGSGRWALPATLTIPAGEGRFPAVVLVHGSGPNDRDETIGPNKPFKDIAWGLATRGIAVLRYEKRTKEYGAEIAALEDGITVMEETIEDAISAVSLLREMEQIDAGRIFVLGHSLGAMLLPRIGKMDPDITGLVLMAGLTRPLEDVIVEQYRYIFSRDGKLSESERTRIEELESQAAKVKDPELSVATPRDELPLGAHPRYWMDLRGYDPPEEARKLKQPMLVLQGERDYQVTMGDFENWRNSLSDRSDMELHAYPKLNHLFIEGEGAPSPEEYNTAGHVSVNVIDDIARWIKKH